MIAWALLLQAAADDLHARYRARTAVEERCAASAHSSDITVCGRRRADTFRVPLVERSSAASDVPAERAALLPRSNPVRDLGPFLVGGGMVGVTIGTRSGVKGQRQRDLAK